MPAAPILRQLTTCSDPSTIVITRRSRAADRPLDYRLEICHRHRWLLGETWPGRRSSESAGGRCGAVLDFRSFESVLKSHRSNWLGPLTAADSGSSTVLRGHALAAALHEEVQWLLECKREPTGVTVALHHAATIAEATASGLLPRADGQRQLLNALSVAETLDAASRGA